MLQACANKRSGKPAVAIKTLTHGCEPHGAVFGEWNSTVSPTESTFCNPASLAIGWGDPNLNAPFSVLDLQRPLRFEVSDFAVGNDDSFEWVYDHQVGVSENEFWLYPEQVRSGSDENSKRDINQQATGWVENGLVYKEPIQDYRQTSPDQIALWAKDSFHVSIISGVTAVGKGK